MFQPVTFWHKTITVLQRFLRANDTCNNSLTLTLALLTTLYPTINSIVTFLTNRFRGTCWVDIWNLFQIGEESVRNCALSPFTPLLTVSLPVAWMLMEDMRFQGLLCRFPMPLKFHKWCKEPITHGSHHRRGTLRLSTITVSGNKDAFLGKDITNLKDANTTLRNDPDKEEKLYSRLT